MRVLLVNTNRCRDLLAPPPVGLSYVASAASDAGHEVELIDLLFSRSPEDDLRRALRKSQPDVVGLSVRNLDNLVRQRAHAHLAPVASLVATVRAESRAPVVLGGSAVSIAGPQAFKRLAADYAVVGEGEGAFVGLLEVLEGRKLPSEVPGLAYAGNGGVRLNPGRPALRFGSSGMERWLDWRPYERIGSTWAIQTKRGCPLGCNYCLYGAIEGTAHRLRPAEEVVDEMERAARRHGPRAFEFVDSTFNLPPDHAIGICEGIVRRGLRTALTAQGVNPLGSSPALFQAMARAGFNSFMVSAEAGSDAMLERLRKGFTMEHVHRTREAVRGSGMVSLWFFMLGGPGETDATVEETVSFAERWLDWEGCLAIFFVGVRVLPGTEVARIAREQGQMSEDNDLLEPTFYLSPEVDERRVVERIRRAVARRATIVHAAEEDARIQRLMTGLLTRLRVAPPHWRFLPRLLGSFPFRELRRLRPDFGRIP